MLFLVYCHPVVLRSTVTFSHIVRQSYAIRPAIPDRQSCSFSLSFGDPGSLLVSRHLVGLERFRLVLSLAFSDPGSLLVSRCRSPEVIPDHL